MRLKVKHHHTDRAYGVARHPGLLVIDFAYRTYQVTRSYRGKHRKP